MTETLEKIPTGQAKAALAAAIDPQSGLDLMTLSTVFVQSGFFSSLESVAQGVVKILAGRELGFPALASVRHIYVHNGHIGLQATLIATKIRQSGIYDYKILESTDKKCAIEFQRKRDGQWITEGTASFTIEEAQRAKLVKPGSGWENYPSDMLFARAVTRGQRRYCPDVFGQTVYSDEEVREIAASEPRAVGGQTLEERAAEMMPREKQPGPVERVLSENPDIPASMAEDIVAAKVESEAGLGQPYQDGVLSTGEPEQPNLPAGQIAPPVTTKKTVFTVGAQRFETNGINRAQMMDLFKIYPRVAKKHGQEKAADVLKNEFHLEHRADLTEEQAERYTIRLKEMLEG